MKLPSPSIRFVSKVLHFAIFIFMFLPICFKKNQCSEIVNCVFRIRCVSASGKKLTKCTKTLISHLLTLKPHSLFLNSTVFFLQSLFKFHFFVALFCLILSIVFHFYQQLLAMRFYRTFESNVKNPIFLDSIQSF